MAIRTVIIGGKAGEGVKKAAQVVANTLFRQGWQVFQADDYQSLIKGGHNFSSVSFSDSEVHTAYAKANLLISFDQRSYTAHSEDMADADSLHVYNSDMTPEAVQEARGKTLGLPLSTMMKQIYGPGGNVSLAAVSVFFLWMGYPQAELEAVIAREFKRNVEDNISYAKAVYQAARQAGIGGSQIPDSEFPLISMEQSVQRFTSGNQAMALGAWLGGLDFYYAYPMTPASSILHYLALKTTTHKVYAIHAESELAAANMAIGSVVSGARTAIGSSGGGFALMQEAFSLAGITEAPLLCFLASRPGPATGVSTYTAQEDLPFALNQGHGEFARIVAAPDSPQRAFSLAAELLSLAWEFQCPVILLSDKHLSESSQNLTLPDEVPWARVEQGVPGSSYQRYSITESGVSPLLFPGSENIDDNTVIKWNSHEHLPSGLRTDKAEAMIAMKDKRNRKSPAISIATQRHERVAFYGEQGTPVFAYGSGVMELREARKHCSKPFIIVALIYLTPFPSEELSVYSGKEIITLEHSSTGNLDRFIRQNLDVSIKHSVLRYDGRPFDPLELAKIMEDIL